MHHVRFRDPAGAVREGTWTDGGVGFGGREYDLADVDVLAPCEPEKIVCIGRNYADHAVERGEEVPGQPLLILKPPDANANHGDAIGVETEGIGRLEHGVEIP